MIIPENIVKDVERIIIHSQDYDFDLPGVKQLIDIWKMSKRRFYPLLGEKLIWQSDKLFTVDLDYEMRDNLAEMFISAAQDYMIEHQCYDDDFINWLIDNKAGFFDNRIVEPFPETDMKVGGKLIKAFKFFLYDEKILRAIQDLASYYIQLTKVEGYPCISIHPIDFLTASENNSNWRSCHALDGDYRSGNLSYITDYTTLVCYLRAKDNVHLKCLPPRMKWNDKKWRMFIHISDSGDIIFFSRQYPFECQELIKELMEHSPLRTLGMGRIRRDSLRNVNTSNGEECLLTTNYIVYKEKGKLIDTISLCSGEKYALNYNDVIFSNSYTPMFAIKNGPIYRIPDVKLLRTIIGENAPCLCGCGRWITEGDKFLSDECHEILVNGLVGRCVNCGVPIYEPDDFKMIGKDMYCLYCAEDLELEEEDKNGGERN